MAYYSHFVHDRLSSSRFSGGRNRAEKEPIPNRARFERKAPAQSSRATIYVTVLYAAEGLRNDEIAARLDTPRQIVSKWRKRFFEKRLAGLEEQSRGGRPVRFPAQRGYRPYSLVVRT